MVIPSAEPGHSPGAPSYMSNRSSIATDSSTFTSPETTPNQHNRDSAFSNKTAVSIIEEDREYECASSTHLKSSPSIPPEEWKAIQSTGAAVPQAIKVYPAQHDSTITHTTLPLNVHPAEAQVARHQTIKLVSNQDPMMDNNPSHSEMAEENLKIKELREQIERESISLANLEKLAQDLPKLKRLSQVSASIIHHPRESSLARSNTSGSGSSKVIVNLQNTIDVLTRELRDKTETANQEMRANDALRKRCEIMDSSMEVLRHQNDMLNQLLDRKERKINDLEIRISRKDVSLDEFEKSEAHLAAEHHLITGQLNNAQQEKLRLEMSYKSLVQSTREIKDRHDKDVKEIGHLVAFLKAERQEDITKMASLEHKLKDISGEKDKLQKLQADTALLRKNHLEQIDLIFSDMRRVVSQSDSTLELKIEGIMQEVENFKNYNPLISAEDDAR